MADFTLVSDFLDGLGGRSVETRRRYASALRRAEGILGDCRPDDPAALETFHRRMLALGMQPATILTNLAGLRAYLRYLVVTDRVNPATVAKAEARLAQVQVRPVHAPPRPPDDIGEVRRVVREYGRRRLGGDERRRWMRDRLMIEVLWSTGLRREELARLDKPEPREWDGELVVHGKGGKTRMAYLPPEAVRDGVEYLSIRIDDSRRLFVRHGSPHEGEPLSTRGVGYIVETWGRRAGVPVHPHQFRHNWARQAIKRGLPLEIIQDLMGHSSPTTTKNLYARYEQEHLRRAAAHVWLGESALPWPRD
jgi:integrase